MHRTKNGENFLFWSFEPEPRECNVRSLRVNNTVNTDHSSTLDYFTAETVANILITDLNLICDTVNTDHDLLLLFSG